MTKYEQQTAVNRDKAKFVLGEIIVLARRAIDSVDDVMQIVDDADHADWAQGYVDRIAEIHQDMLELKNFGKR